jgi:hypothetical protein
MDKNYKQREKEEKEYYFVIESKFVFISQAF